MPKLRKSYTVEPFCERQFYTSDALVTSRRMRTAAAIPVARRVGGFTYAIRNIVAEARKVEAAGKTVRYLNIGDPVIFGFKTPPHMVEAVARAARRPQRLRAVRRHPAGAGSGGG